VVTSLVNKALIYSRSALEEPEPIADDPPMDVPIGDGPRHDPPEWLLPYLSDDGNKGTDDDDCPF
jgi:hypothetical protein